MACLLTVLPLKPRARRYGSEPTNVDYEIQQRFIEWHLVYAPVPFARQTGLPLNRQGTALQVAAALIIEDDVLVRMAAMDAADEVGFVVLGAQNADEALRVLHARSDVLVVVTDINMPGSMDGLALAHFQELNTLVTRGINVVLQQLAVIKHVDDHQLAQGHHLLQLCIQRIERQHPVGSDGRLILIESR